MVEENGDKVRVVTKDRTEVGILMPSPKDDVILIKLSNGYNLGFKKNKVEKIEIIEKKKEVAKKELKKVLVKKGMKTVTILHCGGTIASKVDYETGAVSSTFTPQEILELFPELAELVNLKSRLIANMLSENMRFAHYNIIAKEIEKVIKDGTDGIIITHGTDTLHYTSAALSFILDGLSVPIIMTGSQKSSDRGSSDAFLNMKCASQFIAKSDFVGVGICMHSSTNDNQCIILPGVSSRKMHSSRRDAFKAINSFPYALVDSDGEIDWLDENYPKEKGKLKLKLFKENLKIGILKSHPQMFASEVKFFEKFDGLIIEGTGLGHFPVEESDDYTEENKKILYELGKLTEKIPVVMATQTIYGGVNLNVYSTGRMLEKAGVLGNGYGMTSETSFIKLAWLLSNYPPKKNKELIGENLRGEVKARLEYVEDFLEEK